MKHYTVEAAAHLLGISEKTLRRYSNDTDTHPRPYGANKRYKVYSEEDITALRAHMQRVRLVEAGVFDPEDGTVPLAQKPSSTSVYPLFAHPSEGYLEPPDGVISTQSWCRAHGVATGTFWKFQERGDLKVLRAPDGKQFLRQGGRRFTVGMTSEQQHAAWVFFHDGRHGAFTACADCPHDAG